MADPSKPVVLEFWANWLMAALTRNCTFVPEAMFCPIWLHTFSSCSSNSPRPCFQLSIAPVLSIVTALRFGEVEVNALGYAGRDLLNDPGPRMFRCAPPCWHITYSSFIFITGLVFQLLYDSPNFIPEVRPLSCLTNTSRIPRDLTLLQNERAIVEMRKIRVCNHTSRGNARRILDHSPAGTLHVKTTIFTNQALSSQE